MPIAIQTKDLSRVFETYEKPDGLWNSIRGFWDRKYISKTALHPTNLEIESGQIIGLVGANGAGKTTLLKLLSGLIYPSSGDARVLGHRPWEREQEFLRRISILLGQKNQLWWDLPPSDSFNLLARIYDVDLKAAKGRVAELAALLDCAHVLNIQLRRLSLGERMKMEIIGALLHEPEVLFLDEPTIGLDIVAQTAIRNFLGKYVKEKGPTVILTSHYMDDIAKLADRLLLISRGSIVYNGTVGSFIAKAENEQKISFRYSEPLGKDLPLTQGLELKAGQADFTLQVPSAALPETLAKITTNGSVLDLKIEEADFEEVIRRFLETESGFFPARRNL